MAVGVERAVADPRLGEPLQLRPVGVEERDLKRLARRSAEDG